MYEAWLAMLRRDYADRILPITAEIAEEWGSLNVPDPMPTIDGFMAATAAVHHLTLVSRNTADVEPSGVPVRRRSSSGGAALGQLCAERGRYALAPDAPKEDWYSGAHSSFAVERIRRGETPVTAPGPEQVRAAIQEVAGEWAAARRNRQRRRELDPADFQRLRETGFPLLGVPRERGGLWEGVPRTVRLAADLLRTLAAGDSSPALVAAMHPAVLAFWLGTSRVPDEHQGAWDAQVWATAEPPVPSSPATLVRS